MQIPEGKATVVAEGGDLSKALALAAEELSVHPSQVDHKIDLSHFRSALGTSVSRNTVKIIAWASDRDVDEAPAKKARAPRKESSDEGGEKRERRSRDRDDREDRGRGRDRDDRRSRDRDDRRSRGRDDRRSGGRDRDDDRSRERRGAADGETDASKFAKEWFETTLKHMDVASTVVATGDDERVHVAITAERAGRVVGRRGTTLRAIRHLLGLAIEQQFGEKVIDVDVDDDRPREEREERDDRDDRRERRSRDRGDRGDRRSRGRSGGRGRGKGELSEKELREVAARAAARVQENGGTITIKYAANSYDRRLMHLTIADFDGVESNSKEVEVDGRTVKYVQVSAVED